MLSLVVSLLLLARLACCVGIQNPDSEASEKPSNVRQQKVAGDGAWPPPPVLDTRYIASSTHSTVMLQEAYLDQPYCVVSTSAFKTENHTSRVDDEAAASVRWVCVITADKFHEGGTGEHVVRCVRYPLQHCSILQKYCDHVHVRSCLVNSTIVLDGYVRLVDSTIMCCPGHASWVWRF